MKRTKRRTAVLLGAAALLACGLAFAGCSQDRLTTDDLIEMGFVHTVTFDLQGGKSGERTELVQQVQDNSLVVEPGTNVLVGEEPTRSGFTFNAFCRGTEDADGNVTYGEEWDFERDRVTEDITLYARWLSNYSITVHYGDEYKETYTVPVTQDAQGNIQPLNSITISGQTVLDGFYTSAADAEKKENVITFPYTPTGLTQENTTVELWTNTLDGVWKLVETAEDLRSFYNGTNIYLLNDIDFGGEELSFPEAYTGTFEGNGHTLSNFTVSQAAGTGAGVQSFGLFRELRATASIHNVTFKNVTYVAELDNPIVTEYRAGVLAGNAAKGAKVENVTISGGTFTFAVADQYSLYDYLEVNVLVGGEPAEGTVTNCTISSDVTVEKITWTEWQNKQEGQDN